MNVSDKTKKELIDELEAARIRVSELEKNEKYSRQTQEGFGHKANKAFPQPAHMHEGLVIVFNRKLEFVNDIFAELFGVSPEEACSPGFDPMTLIAPQSRRFIRKQYSEGCRGSYKTKQINYTGLSRDGGKIECEAFLLFIPYKWGMAIQCTINGVSVSKRIDEALKGHYSDIPGSLTHGNQDTERQMRSAE